MTTTMAPDETLDRRSAARIVTIVVVRHGQPHADRTVRVDHRGYREWWRSYDQARLHPEEKPPPDLVRLAGEADVIYASTLPRAIHTAQMVAGGRDVITDPVFIEAPLPPPPLWGRRRPAAANIVAKTGRSEQEARAALAKVNPMQRLVTPEEVADTILWLASEGASSITGQAVAVAGGEVFTG